MSDNDLASKLAKGMRRAKDPAAASVPAADKPVPSSPGTHSGASSVPVAASTVASQVHKRTGSAPRAGAARFAEQGDQSPPASLDRPWENLHPKRIWPD